MRALLLADTHVGIDDPLRPRVQRRRRGPDFLCAFERALRPALERRVDLVIHGGDLLYRARVPARLVQRAMAPLLEVADAGVPVFLVPGNHERSRIPFPLLAMHRNIRIFHRPETFTLEVENLRVAISGFPFAGRVGNGAFSRLVDATRWREQNADVRLLCMHQAVEGATVGVQDFTFRRGADVVAGREIPRGFAAILSGHIHRSQVLTHDLEGIALAAPVLYPGSVDRTSFAERLEEKGYLLLQLARGPAGGRLLDRSFVPLPTRPMVLLELDAEGMSAHALEDRIRSDLRKCPPDAVVRIDPRGALLPGAEAALSAARLRSIAPATMNVTVPHRWLDAAGRSG
ncbi:MAG: metallophosphoesterase family protein [Planctomycetota bacterium]